MRPFRQQWPPRGSGGSGSWPSLTCRLRSSRSPSSRSVCCARGAGPGPVARTDARGSGMRTRRPGAVARAAVGCLVGRGGFLTRRNRSGRTPAALFGLASRARFVVGDLAHTGLPQASADAAVSIDAFHFAADPAAAAAEARRILRPGGRLVEFASRPGPATKSARAEGQHYPPDLLRLMPPAACWKASEAAVSAWDHGGGADRHKDSDPHAAATRAGLGLNAGMTSGFPGARTGHTRNGGGNG